MADYPLDNAVHAAVDALVNGQVFPELPHHMRLAMAQFLLTYSAADKTGDALKLMAHLDNWAREQVAILQAILRAPQT